MLSLWNLSNIEIYSGINTSILILSITSIIFGILVISSNNAVVSVLYLIVLFVNLSIYLLLFGYTFLGLSLIIVYVGAIAILFLFVIMLLDISASSTTKNIEDLRTTKNYSTLSLLLLFIMILPIYNVINHISNDININIISLVNDDTVLYSGISYFIYYPIYWILLNITHIINNSGSSSNTFINKNNDILGIDNNNVYEHIDYIWNQSYININDIQSLGYVIYSIYPITFYIIGLLLLISMIGSIVISSNKNK